jgi:23S rRNA pseudouridine1911/1915/1917 synthase
MNPPPLEILYEDNHLLVLNKPAGLPTMGTPSGRPTLLTLAKEDVKRRYQKPGNVYLGVMSRLDAPVTGVVLLARTSKAAARLTKQFLDRTVEKSYWAVVEGVLESPAGQLVDWLAQDERHRRMHIVGSTLPGAREARLGYRQLKALAGAAATWLEIGLETGRKHQIRLQLSHHGHPIIGDRKYGGRVPFPAGIALHARRLVILHPTTAARLEFQAPLPDTWRQFGVEPQD